ncbi:MAG: glycosyltransferase family 4 protein [Thermoleophilaceae bacterium]|nr:glycosyltransferase family 4 protein [Thermoleophilaceae bacterium]
MRVLIFHGYLLRGRGSNIYTANLCRALAALGHDVHLLCQERAAGDLDLVDAVGRWEDGELRVRGLRDPARVTVYLPDIGRTLPVYVADVYEGFDAVPYPDLDTPALERYLDANVTAVEDVVALVKPDVALANHLVMGPAILARGLAGRVPYAVKIHGSALEYTVRPHPGRFLPYALEGLAGARGVLVGSRHTAESLWEVTGDPELPDRTRLGPPGVEVGEFRPRAPAERAAALASLAGRLEKAGTAGWGGEAGAGRALRALDPGRDRIVGYVGKLIVSKGVDLLLAAWPLVVARVPDARLCIVGFGTYRDALAGMVRALAEGNLAALRDIAARGRELEGGPRGELTYLAAFLDTLAGARRNCYLAAAPAAARRVHFTGRLEHGDLPSVLPAWEALVMPSTFPEAFGMVAAEGAACGALPLSAAHSGLAEVTAILASGLDEPLRPLLSFERGPGAVEEIAAKLVSWLELDAAERVRAAGSLAETARRRFGWEGVAQGVIAGALGRLEELPVP